MPMNVPPRPGMAKEPPLPVERKRFATEHGCAGEGCRPPRASRASPARWRSQRISARRSPCGSRPSPPRDRRRPDRHASAAPARAAKPRRSGRRGRRRRAKAREIDHRQAGTDRSARPAAQPRDRRLRPRATVAPGIANIAVPRVGEGGQTAAVPGCRWPRTSASASTTDPSSSAMRHRSAGPRAPTRQSLATRSTTGPPSPPRPRCRRDSDRKSGAGQTAAVAAGRFERRAKWSGWSGQALMRSARTLSRCAGLFGRIGGSPPDPAAAVDQRRAECRAEPVARQAWCQQIRRRQSRRRYASAWENHCSSKLSGETGG